MKNVIEVCRNELFSRRVLAIKRFLRSLRSWLEHKKLLPTRNGSLGFEILG